MTNICLYTCVHIKDMDRFKLQRESIERSGTMIPHIAVVDHEDMPAFRDIPFQQNLRLVSTREVLSKKTEARRRGYRLRRRQPEWWLCRRYGKGIHGWGIQQVIKLAVNRVTDATNIVCMDTDTICVGPVQESDFIGEDGRTHLYETQTKIDVEMAGWLSSSMRLLGIKQTAQPIYCYTHSPVVLHSGILVDLQKKIHDKHQRDWEETFLETRGVMEYSTYGAYARHIDKLNRVTPASPDICCTYWYKDEVKDLRKTLVNRVTKEKAKMLAVQSNTGVWLNDYHDELNQLWDRSDESPVTC